MLETLKFGEGRRMPLATSIPAAPAPGADCVVEWEMGEEVPFVEVGGPNKKVELSPGLMKHPPQPAQPPHVIVETPNAKVVQLTPAQPMSVAFEVWPVEKAVQAISSEVIAYHQPNHAATKEYTLLLDAILTNAKSSEAKVVLALGHRACVGVSTVLANLAALAAQAKKLRTLVLDANADAGVSQRLGIHASQGLAGVLKGTLALEQALVETAIPSLHVLPAGKTAGPLPAEAVAWLIACLRDRFDLVLIDGPALDDRTDHCLYIPHVDNIYVVLPQGESANVGKGAAHTIARAGGRLCGLIHTHFE
jgi:Mrp family chromosome partitioning ATPase